MSLPRPPMTRSLPALPMILSSPSPPLIVRLTWPALSLDASITSLPASPLMVSESRPASIALDAELRREAVDEDRRAAADDLDVVVGLRAVDDHGVGRAIALPASRRRRQVERDLGDVGAGEVVDRDGVGAAQGRKLDVLDAVEVHDDVGDVAGQPHPRAVGRDVDALVDVGAVEHQRVGAVLALDRVVAVTRIPGERVVAGAEEGDVVAPPAGHGVVAVAAEEDVGARAADDGVVAGAAVDGEADDAGRQRGRVDRVVAGAGVDRQRVAGIGDGRCSPAPQAR